MLKFEFKFFQDLSISELYDILALRAEVFSVEQTCGYQDPDYKDQSSVHLIGLDAAGKMQAYLRIVPAPDKNSTVSMGRIIVRPGGRGKGWGGKLINTGLGYIRHTYGEAELKIDAQCYLCKYYSSFGFIEKGESFLEDGLPHVSMVMKWEKYLSTYG